MKRQLHVGQLGELPTALALVHHQQAQSHIHTNQFQCQQCSRKFRRESDRKRHKCIAERQKPISEQSGAVQCFICSRWLELELESYLTWGAFSQEAILPGAHNTYNINTYQHTYST